MAKSPLRYKRLIKELPHHKHAKDALIASGFSENTAKRQAKRVMSSALKHVAREILQDNDTRNVSSKRLMSEIVGLSGQDVMDRLKAIATQDKDLGSALKVLVPLAKEHGVSIDNTENHVTTPILNILVEKIGDETPVLESSVVDNGLTESYLED